MGRFLYVILWTMLSATEGHYMSAIVRQNPSAQAITNNLERRVYEHKNNLTKGFTAKYNINKLVYFEYTEDVTAAISREKQIKGWCRQNKNELIENTNPEWKDLSEGF